VTISICSWNFGSTSSIEQRTFKYHSKKNLDKIIALNDATGKKCPNKPGHVLFKLCLKKHINLQAPRYINQEDSQKISRIKHGKIIAIPFSDDMDLIDHLLNHFSCFIFTVAFSYSKQPNMPNQASVNNYCTDKHDNKREKRK